MRIRLTLLLALLVALPLAAFDRGEVYFEHSSALPWSSDTYFETWAFAPAWSYAVAADAVPLIDKLVPYLGSGHFFVAAPNQIVFHSGGTMFVWDGVYRRFTDAGNGAVEIFHDDAPLGEIVPMRSGRFLVPAGAKLIEFDLHGRIAEHAFPGAEHVELLGDQCTLLYGAGNRVARMSLCSGTALTDFATLAADDVVGSIRQLPNRDVLVATGNGIAQFTADGALLRTYSFAGATHIALTPDGGAFYAAGVIANRAELRFYGEPKEIPIGNPRMQTAFVPLHADDLVVVGEWRAAAQPMVRRRAAR
jgi:hypothetical protein